MKDKNTNTNKKINYSLELLRLILSFWVVVQHCYKYAYKLHKGKFHVPTFMVISYYFYYNILKTKIIIKIKQRFQRITIPYFIWPIFVYITNNVLFKLFGFSQFNKKIILKNLILQLVFGFNFHFLFYYQFILIFFTIFLLLYHLFLKITS